LSVALEFGRSTRTLSYRKIYSVMSIDQNTSSPVKLLIICQQIETKMNMDKQFSESCATYGRCYWIHVQ